MARPILIIQNIAEESPGLLGEVLRERSIPHVFVDLDRGEHIPPAADFSAMVVLGGPDSANDDTGKMRQELARTQEALAAGMPYLGICLGLQTLVKAAGGRVVPSPRKEIGFFDADGAPYTVTLTEAGARDPLFAGFDRTFWVFQLHGETVELPDTATLLGRGTICPNQIVKIGARAYGLQCHFEITPALFETLLTTHPDLRQQPAAALRAQFAAIENEYARTGRQLFTTFLAIAGYADTNAVALSDQFALCSTSTASLSEN